MKETKYAGLKAQIGREETISELGGLAVIVGLVADVVLAYVFRQGKTVIEAFGPAAANFVVMLGVVFELWFARRARTKAEELQIALETDLEASRQDTERLRIASSWRHLPLETVKLLGDELAKIPPRIVAIVLTMGDAESIGFAREFDRIFKQHGWQTTLVVAGYAGDPVYGLRISVAYTDERRDMGMRLREAFTKAGIEFLPGEPPRAFMTTPEDHPPSGQMAVLYVGPRGEPEL